MIESDQLSKIRKARIKNEVTAMLNDRVNRYIDKNVVATSEFDILVENFKFVKLSRILLSLTLLVKF